jgi:hypothetical protein
MIFRRREDEDLAVFLVRWIARVSSVAVFVLLMLFAFGEDGVTGGVTSDEAVGLLFFPAGVALGFLLGWKNELVGGLVSAASLACFYLVYGLAFTGHAPRGVWFAIFTTPGFLFLTYGVTRLLRSKAIRPTSMKLR